MTKRISNWLVGCKDAVDDDAKQGNAKDEWKDMSKHPENEPVTGRLDP